MGPNTLLPQVSPIHCPLTFPQRIARYLTRTTSKWRAWTATVATIALAASFGLMELILILTLRGPYSRGVEWPMMLMAVSATVIQVVGLIQPYFELAKRSGRVIGIDFWFLTIDYAGAFFSLMAVVAQQWFDALGASLYIACMVLETGIFFSQAVWLWRVRKERSEAKKAGLSYDEYVAKHPEKKLPRSMSTETFVDVEAGRQTEKMEGVVKEEINGKDAAGSALNRIDSKHDEPQPPPPVVVRNGARRIPQLFLLATRAFRRDGSNPSA
jgi:hypothetical protein